MPGPWEGFTPEPPPPAPAKNNLWSVFTPPAPANDAPWTVRDTDDGEGVELVHADKPTPWALPRKRGRPKKPVEAGVVVIEEPEPRRRPGRPRKVPPAREEGRDTAERQKRRRGRPRKEEARRDDQDLIVFGPRSTRKPREEEPPEPLPEPPPPAPEPPRPPKKLPVVGQRRKDPNLRLKQRLLRKEELNGRLIAEANYAAVEASSGRYGLIDTGGAPGGAQALIMHVPSRELCPWKVLTPVRPGALLAVRRAYGTPPMTLRVRFTTPDRYYSPGAAVRTLSVGVDGADWRAVMASASGI